MGSITTNQKYLCFPHQLQFIIAVCVFLTNNQLYYILFGNLSHAPDNKSESTSLAEATHVAKFAERR